MRYTVNLKPSPPSGKPSPPSSNSSRSEEIDAKAKVPTQAFAHPNRMSYMVNRHRQAPTHPDWRLWMSRPRHRPKVPTKALLSRIGRDLRLTFTVKIHSSRSEEIDVKAKVPTQGFAPPNRRRYTVKLHRQDPTHPAHPDWRRYMSRPRYRPKTLLIRIGGDIR